MTTRVQELATYTEACFGHVGPMVEVAAELRRLDATLGLNVKLLNWVDTAEQKAGALQRRLNAAETEIDVLRAENARLREALATRLAQAWDEGYQAGINDERTSEANIGIAGLGAKVQPARNNPYGAAPTPVAQRPEPADGWVSAYTALQQDRDALAARVSYLETAASDGGAWVWQGDGDDHPESMVGSLPVIIRADQLRALIAPPAPVAPAEFEVRDDGERVRVDRWEVGIRRIVALLWGNRHAFEVDEVVEAVRALVPAPNDDDEGLVRAVLAAPVPVAQPVMGLPADFLAHSLSRLTRERAGLEGFISIGNELHRAATYDRWISALKAAIEATGQEGGAA